VAVAVGKECQFQVSLEIRDFFLQICVPTNDYRTEKLILIHVKIVVLKKIVDVVRFIVVSFQKAFYSNLLIIVMPDIGEIFIMMLIMMGHSFLYSVTWLPLATRHSRHG
jgi:hypothetical protein